MRRSLRRADWEQGGALLVALLILAAGFCVFDGGGHGHDDDAARDLCLGMIVASLAVPLLAGPRVSGWVPVEPRTVTYAVSPHLPDPPPKRDPLS